MKNVNNHFAISVSLNIDELVVDLQHCSLLSWSEHFNKSDYSGKWKSIALMSISGNSDDIRSIPGCEYRITDALRSCRYIPAMLDSLQFKKESVRFLCLQAGSEIKTHRDLGLSYQNGYFRLHVPILTSSGIQFKVDGEQVDMKPGECWYADFDRPHSVSNTGNGDRIHLVIDGIRNEWTDQLFAKAGYDFEAEKKAIQPDRRTTLATIAELEHINSDTSRAMIAELKQRLNED